MTFIRIFTATTEDKVLILDWIMRRLYSFKDVSLNQLIIEFGDKISIQDNDMFGYWDVGWNVNDLIRLNNSRGNIKDLEIPGPRLRFWKMYM